MISLQDRFLMRLFLDEQQQKNVMEYVDWHIWVKVEIKMDFESGNWILL